MVACTEMDDETHGVLRRITERGVTKKGYAKITRMTLAKEFDLPWREMTLLMEDLQECGFLILDDQDHILLEEMCSCVAQTSLLDTGRGSEVHPAPLRTGRRDGSSQGETQPPYGGQGSPPGRHAETAISTNPPDSDPKRRRVTPSGKFAGRRGKRPDRSPPETPHDLAWMLWREVRDMRWRYGIVWTGGVSVGAVTREIAKWMREDGIPASRVRAMIEEFASGPGWIREGIPAWKSFLANRQALATRADERERRGGPRETEEDWLSFADNPIETEEDWLSG